MQSATVRTMVFFALRKIAGILCVVFGLFALVTPLTPGAWLILVGLELLGLSFLLPKSVSVRWEGWKQRVRAKIGVKRVE